MKKTAYLVLMIWWEISGYVPKVVFTCGAVPEDDGTVKIYWGRRGYGYVCRYCRDR